MIEQTFPIEVPKEGEEITFRFATDWCTETAIVDCRVMNCEGICIVHLQNHEGKALGRFLKYSPRDHQWYCVHLQNELSVEVYGN